MKLSEEIATLSSGTGPYYERIEDWYEALKIILQKHECFPNILPEIHTNEGRGFVEFTGTRNGQIYFTWYKMPSGRFEVICYLS